MPSSLIEDVETKLKEKLPTVEIAIDPPLLDAGVWFLDLKLGDRSVAIQWSPTKGFGLTTSDSEDYFGQNPDEFCEDVDMVVRRSVELLLGD